MEPSRIPCGCAAGARTWLSGCTSRDQPLLAEWSQDRWSFLAISEAVEELPRLLRAVASGLCLPGWDRRPWGRDFIVIAPFHLGRRRVRVVVRPYRRGGALRGILKATYWGVRPRSFDEFRTLVELQGLGVAVVPPVGAAAYWLGRWRYQAWLVTEYVEGSMTLWDWLQEKPAEEKRVRMLEAVAQVIARFHRAGGTHPDLNLRNVLVQCREAVPCAWLVDLDRVVLQPHPTTPRPTLRRLWRSATKLDPARRHWSVSDQRFLKEAVDRHWTEE